MPFTYYYGKGELNKAFTVHCHECYSVFLDNIH